MTADPAIKADADTSGIRVPPPTYYLAGLLGGLGLELAFPIDGPPLWVVCPSR